MQLTESFIKKLQPGPRPKMISDRTSGLQLVVNPGGAKTFYWRGADDKIKLGRWPVIDLDDARDQAKSLAGAVKSGRDPALEAKARKAQVTMTVPEAWALYEKNHLSTLKPNTIRGYNRYWNNDVAPHFGSTVITAITADDIDMVRTLAEQRSMRVGWHVHSVCGSFFGWLHSARHIGANPMPAKPRHWKMPVRDRHFLKDELPTILRALHQISEEEGVLARWAIANLVLLHTGQRMANILYARDDQIVDGVLHIKAANFKGNRKHEVPFSPQVLALLGRVHRPDPESSRIFQDMGSESHSMDRLRARVKKLAGKPIEKWTMHTHRKTVETLLLEEWDEEADRELTDQSTVDSILGHTVKGASAHYNFALMLRKKRRVLNAWSDILDRLAG